jgi:2-oxoglutarate/2-oxoacid ferredoxin oxidoreductase subunit beta
MATIEDYKSIEPAWCPGCGDFGILNAVKKALVVLGKSPEEVLLVSGIGQAAKLPHYLRGNVFNGLHGRALPAAQAAKIANSRLTVIAVGGDGDMYGEGGNHLLHAIRRNLDLTLLVHDNKIYGLTKGQASPTTDPGVRTKVQPGGVISGSLNPLTLAISQHAAFVARAFSGNIDHLTEMIVQGVKHPGFSLIDILQPCVSFNKVNTFAWYKSRVYDLAQAPAHDPADWSQALLRASEWGERIPVGVFYRVERPTYSERVPALEGTPLIEREADPKCIEKLLENYA